TGSMNILGLNAFHGDSSAASIRADQLLCAIEEERFNRIKHWAGLPVQAAQYCLNGDQPDHIAISRDPRANLKSKLMRAALRPLDWPRLAGRANNSLRISRVADELHKEG